MRGRPRKNYIPSKEVGNVIEAYTVYNKSLKQLAEFYEVTTYQVREVLSLNDVPLNQRGRPKGYKPPKKIKVEDLTKPLGS